MNSSQVRNTDHIGIFQVAILILSILILCALAADTLLVLQPQVRRVIQDADTIVCVVLLADFVTRFWRAESKLVFMKWGWIDLVASIPNLDILPAGSDRVCLANLVDNSRAAQLLAALQQPAGGG